ncbi:MAG TPA: NAD(P)-binding domain-containing protein [Longimicrobiales bacterium]
MRIVDEATLRRAVTVAGAVSAVEAAFAALARGEARLPPPINLDIPEAQGEVHVKGGHMAGSPFYAFKVATGFYANERRGLPNGSGMVFVGDAATGFPAALLLDNGWLTDLRTGAAGAVAVKHLARTELWKVAVLGAGVQARMQLRCLAAVREPDDVVIWSRSLERAAACAADVQQELGVRATVAASAEEAVRDADLVYTVTPSRAPLLLPGWLAAGALVVAVGSDGPQKQELDVGVLAQADRLVADHLGQCLRLGELHHAVDAGVVEPAAVVELGDVVLGRVSGRRSALERIVCDLTGVGVQDAAIASAAMAALDAAAGPEGAVLGHEEPIA